MENNTAATADQYLDGFDEATVIEKLPYPEKGQYVTTVDKLKMFGTKTGKKFFGGEFTVTEAASGSRFKPGEKFQYLIQLNSQYAQSSMKSVRLAVAAILNEPANSITKAAIAEIADDATNPAAGTKVRIAVEKEGDAYPKLTFAVYRG